MKISATVTFAVLASINTETALARCFFCNVGGTYNAAEAKEWIDHACRANGGIFTGNFAPGQTKSMCPTTKKGSHTKTKFEVQNQNQSQGFDLGDNNCVKRLYSEIYSCKVGGESSYSSWCFK